MRTDQRPPSTDRHRPSIIIPERRVAESLMIEIRKFIPFKADCCTLISDFYHRCYGIEIPRYEYNSVKQEKPPDKVWEDWEIIEESEIVPGDVILLYDPDLGVHTGIVLDEGEFLHTICMDNPPVRIRKISDIPRDETPVTFLRYRK